MGKKLNLFSELRQLDLQAANLVAISLTQRMFINAQIYFTHTKQTKELVYLQQVMDNLWAFVSTGKKVTNIETTIEKMLEITNTLPSDNVGAFSARDFIVSMIQCVESNSEPDAQIAVTIAKISQGDIERYLELIENREITPEAFRQHELVQNEINIITALMQATRGLAPASIAKDIRSELLEQNLSNLGLSF